MENYYEDDAKFDEGKTKFKAAIAKIGEPVPPEELAAALEADKKKTRLAERKKISQATKPVISRADAQHRWEQAREDRDVA